MAPEEQVLVVERKVVEQIGMFQGLVFDVKRYLDEIFVPGVPRFMPRSQAEREVRRMHRLGLRGTWPGRDDFPPWLAEIPDPPMFLYVRGHLERDPPRLAIVGSRRASVYGKRVASDLGELAADAGFEVVSGGARGIDARAHRGALARRGRTVAVVAGGLDAPYPEDHAGLFDKIARKPSDGIGRPPSRETSRRRLT